MKNSIFSRPAKLFGLALLFVCALSLTGCPKPIDSVETPETKTPKALAEGSTLIGSWTSTNGETFVITTTTLSNGGSWGDCYAGDNLATIKTDETSGYIYIKYTRAANADWTYSETAPDVGKWYAISYKNLTETSVSFSGAYKADGKSAADTLDDAVTEFTIDNGYFGTYSECTKDAE